MVIEIWLVINLKTKTSNEFTETKNMRYRMRPSLATMVEWFFGWSTYGTLGHDTHTTDIRLYNQKLSDRQSATKMSGEANVFVSGSGKVKKNTGTAGESSRHIEQSLNCTVLRELMCKLD